MAAANTLKEYEEFGKQLVEFGVDTKDLETRINGLGPKVSDDQKKSVVTGYVDRLMDADYRETTSYELVHGFARWMYNGNFEDVRANVLQLILKRAERDTGPLEMLQKRGDDDALRQISEMALESNPSLTYDWYPQEGEGRKEILRKVVDKHYKSKDEETEQLIVNCLKELEDTDKLRAFANERVEKKQEMAWRILAEHGTPEDIRAAISVWEKKDVLHAYHASEFFLDRRAIGTIDKDYEKHGALHDRVVQEQPKELFELIRYDHSSGRHYRRHSSRGEINKVFLAIGKRFFALGKMEDAIEAFDKANYEGDEYREIGTHALKNHKKLFGEETYKNYQRDKYKRAMTLAAPKFFEQGGDTEIASGYIDIDHSPDDTKRKFGKAFAELPRGKDDDHADRAYRCMMLITKKSSSDKESIIALRDRMIARDSEWSVNTFIGFEDEVGMRAYLAHNRKQMKPDDLYSLAGHLKDEALRKEARQAVIADKGLRASFYTFKEAQDQIGMNQVEEQLTKGVDPDFASKMLPIDKVKN